MTARTPRVLLLLGLGACEGVYGVQREVVDAAQDTCTVSDLPIGTWTVEPSPPVAGVDVTFKFEADVGDLPNVELAFCATGSQTLTFDRMATTVEHPGNNLRWTFAPARLTAGSTQVQVRADPHETVYSTKTVDAQ